MFLPLSERGYDEQRLCGLTELKLPECGYWLDVQSSRQFVMRTAERVCLGMFLDGSMVEVQGPVQAE